jgi:hypothetical protein
MTSRLNPAKNGSVVALSYLTFITWPGSALVQLCELLVLVRGLVDLRTHMKRYVKALQILCLVHGGLRGCVMWLGGERGRAGLIPCPG